MDNTVRRRILIAVLAASVLPIVQSAMASSALFAIKESYELHPHASQLVRILAVGPALAVVLAGLWIGMLADYIENRRLLVSGLVIYALCGVWAYFSSSLELIVATRLVLGMSVAILRTATTTLIGHYFAGPEREQVLGWQAAVVALGSAIFPLVGGAIASIDWRMMFLVYVMALALIPLVLALPTSTTRKPGVRAAFSYSEVLDICAISFLGTLVLCLMTTQFAFHSAAAGETSPLWVGLVLSVSGLSAAIFSAGFRRIRSYLTYPLVAAIAFLCMGVGYFVIGLSAAPVHVMAATILAGVGFGLYIPNGAAWLLSRVSAESRGRALGILATLTFLGQFLSAFIYEAMVNALGSPSTFVSVGAASLLVSLVILVAYPGARQAWGREKAA